MNFYPFHIGDYISHTSHLNDAEDLAYRRMIDLYYQTEKPFQDIHSIARKVKSNPQTVRMLLDEFFDYNEEDKHWHNKRADEEINKFKLMSLGGKKGAAKRWGGNSPPIAPLSPTHSPPKHPLIATKNQEPRTINQVKTNTTISPPDGVSVSLWKDFLILRRSKKLPVTETALKGIIRESKIAKLSVSEVLQICCERGWGGFKAEWLAKEAQKATEMPLGSDKEIEKAYTLECGGNLATARFNNYYEMKKFVLDFREKKAKS